MQNAYGSEKNLLNMGTKLLHKKSIYLSKVISPFLRYVVPSVKVISNIYTYTSWGCNSPLYLPSQPCDILPVLNSGVPQRLKIRQSIFCIPNPFTVTRSF